MAASELPVCAATLFALDKAESVLGQPLRVFVVDGRSDEDVFERQARYLVRSHKVPVIFGCWRSVDRVRAVTGMGNDCLLVYPVQYEGFPIAEQVLYLGATPNQQLIPAMEWYFKCLDAGRFQSGPIVFLGSDYLYPLWAQAILEDLLTARGKKFAEVKFLAFRKNPATQHRQLIEQTLGDIAKMDPQPTLLLNTINGIDNMSFLQKFSELRTSGAIDPACTLISFCLGETEIEQIGGEWARDTFVSTSYLESLRNPSNIELKDEYTSWVNNNRSSSRQILDGWTLGSLLDRAHPRVERIRLSDPMQKAIFGARFWQMLAERAQAPDRGRIVYLIKELKRGELSSQSTPEGKVEFIAKNMHWKRCSRVGKVVADGTIEIVHETPLLYPQPFLKQEEFPAANRFFDQYRANEDAYKHANPSEPWVRRFQSGELSISGDGRALLNLGGCFHNIPEMLTGCADRSEDISDARMQSIINELKQHNCSDGDYRELFSLFGVSHEDTTPDGRARMALCAAKVKALVYRLASGTDRHRVYLFDLLHFAAARGEKSNVYDGVGEPGDHRYMKLEEFKWLMSDPATEVSLKTDQLQRPEFEFLFDLAIDATVTHHLLRDESKYRYVMMWKPKDLDITERLWEFDKFLWGKNNLSSKFRAMRLYFMDQEGKPLLLAIDSVENNTGLWKYKKGVTVELSLIETNRVNQAVRQIRMRLIGVREWQGTK
jgi:urea transport system substrate-binding protein